MAENWNFAFNIGAKDSNECAVISQSKGRRTGHHGEKIIKIEGAYSRIVGADSEYRLDSGRIVSAKDFQQAGHDSENPAKNVAAAAAATYVAPTMSDNGEDEEDDIDAGA